MAAFADKPGSRARATPHRIRKGQIRKKLHKIASDATHQQPEVAKKKRQDADPTR
jgi:hypothetical protein